jgi:hypothetical protein
LELDRGVRHPRRAVGAEDDGLRPRSRTHGRGLHCLRCRGLLEPGCISLHGAKLPNLSDCARAASEPGALYRSFGTTGTERYLSVHFAVAMPLTAPFECRSYGPRVQTSNLQMEEVCVTRSAPPWRTPRSPTAACDRWILQPAWQDRPVLARLHARPLGHGPGRQDRQMARGLVFVPGSPPPCSRGHARWRRAPPTQTAMSCGS